MGTCSVRYTGINLLVLDINLMTTKLLKYVIIIKRYGENNKARSWTMRREATQ